MVPDPAPGGIVLNLPGCGLLFQKALLALLGGFLFPAYWNVVG